MDRFRPSWHGACVARHDTRRGWHGVLLLGDSGSGKSDLALRLIDRGFHLVSDDRVLIADGIATPPPALAGLIEVRGLGLLRMTPVFPVRLVLVVELGQPMSRLPPPALHPVLGLTLIRLAAFEAASALRVALALDCVIGERHLASGAVIGDMHMTHDRNASRT